MLVVLLTTYLVVDLRRAGMRRLILPPPHEREMDGSAAGGRRLQHTSAADGSLLMRLGPLPQVAQPFLKSGALAQRLQGRFVLGPVDVLEALSKGLLE